MKIINTKKFILSCIFFTLLFTLFGKYINLIYSKASKEESSSVVMAVDKSSNKGENKKYTVVLDAGHGGIDKGTSYQNMNEKDLTLKIVKYAQEYLKNKGYIVILTRNEDKLIPLKQIGNIANNANADVFVSIHVNSISDVNFKGITTLYYDVNGYEKDERIKLSQTIEDEAVKSDGWESKGIKRQNVAVLRYSKIPCALVECGFITNKEDRERLSKDDVLKRLSENISNGIIKYLDENHVSGYSQNIQEYNKNEYNTSNVINSNKQDNKKR